MNSLSLLDQFFREAREIVANERSEFSVAPHDLLKIAEQPAVRSEFDRRLTALNDPDLKRLIEDFVRDAAGALADAVAVDDSKIELLDRAGLSVAGSVTAAGLGATIVVIAKGAGAGSLVGPVGMLAGGLVGLIVVGFARHRLKQQNNARMSWIRKLKRLIGKD